MNKKFLTIGILVFMLSMVFAGSYIAGTILNQNEFNNVNLNTFDFEESIVDKMVSDDALIVTFQIDSFEKVLDENFEETGEYVAVDKNIVLKYWKERYVNCRADNNSDYCMAMVNKNFVDRLEFEVNKEKELVASWQTASIYDDELLSIDTYYYDLPEYEVGKDYNIGDSFMFDNVAYEVIQAHTSQADWMPSAIPALYKYKSLTSANGGVSAWVQPTGSEDAYNIGDRVSYEGSIYESLINANVWSPNVYPAGWLLIE